MDSIEMLLSHNTIYFPWADGDGYPDAPVNFTVVLARHLRLPVTVVCSVKNQIPDVLERADYITERSQRRTSNESVWLIFYPSRKLLDRPIPKNARYVVAAEWVGTPLDTWAEKRSAWNIRTNKTMQLDIPPEVNKLYDLILWNGNNGWADKAGKRDALRDLQKLKALGRLDKQQLIGYLTGIKSSRALTRLEALVDRVL